MRQRASKTTCCTYAALFRSLLAVRELSDNRVGIFSGERFDVDSSVGLSGECDFLLTLSDPVPIIRAPVFFVVEAKIGRAPSELQSQSNLVCRLLLEKKKSEV